MLERYYRQATFLKSAADIRQCPQDHGIEIAFAGRSNAGKSSALNCITDNKQLAKTSKTPGRTQLINLFQLPDGHRLVDLPGYGYAKVSKKIQKEWQGFLTDYLLDRDQLVGLVLLMDIRHPLKEIDEMILHSAIDRGLKVHVLLTKSDKVNQQTRAKALKLVKSRYVLVDDLVSVQPFSATNKQGLNEVYSVLDSWLGRGEINS